VTYTPAANYNGAASFSYTVTDNGTTNGVADPKTDTATVNVTITEVNDAPTAVADAKSTAEDTALVFAASDLTTNDSTGPANESGQTLTVTAVTATASTHGTVILASGNVTYTPAANYNGAASFSYTVTDNGTTNGVADPKTDTATVNVTINPVNDAPLANDGSATTNEDTATSIDLSALVSDVETLPANLTYTIVSGPSHGALSGSGTSRSYTPDANYNGADSFTYKVTDRGDPDNCSSGPCSAALTSATKTVSITVSPVNDHPVVSNDRLSQTVQYSDPIQTVTVSATDIDSSPASLVGSTQWKKSGDPWLATQPLNGLTLTATGTGTTFPLTWTLTGTARVPAATYIVRVNIDDHGSTDNIGYTDVTIIVTPEDATIDYTGDGLKATSSTTTSTAPVLLSAAVKEATDGSLGDKLNTASLRFDVYKSSNTTMTTADYMCTAPIVASGPGTGTATCSPSLTLPVDNYMVKITYLDGAAGDYYNVPDEVVAVTVTYPGTGFTTGGGWLNETNLQSRSNFGFTVKYLKNGNIQGNSLDIYRLTLSAGNAYSLPAGTYNWIIKANSMTALTQSCNNATPKVCTATFTGKSNVTAVNRTTGIAYSLGGNRSFQVDVTDASEPGSSPGSGPDSYAIRVWDSAGTYYQFGTQAAQIPITGGNIQVRP
jgi:Bacterial Ig domain/Bacterial cadherin-like domain